MHCPLTLSGRSPEFQTGVSLMSISMPMPTLTFGVRPELYAHR